MPKCIMLVGLPGVGKTTWLQDNLDILPPRTDTGYPPFVASMDFYIDECAKILGTTYSQVYPAIVGYAERAFQNDVTTLAFNGYDFIVDRRNLHKKLRREIIDRVMKNAKQDYTFEAIVFKTPEERTHMDRLASRHGRYVPQTEIEEMQRVFDANVPTSAEGFLNIRFVEI